MDNLNMNEQAKEEKQEYKPVKKAVNAIFDQHGQYYKSLTKEKADAIDLIIKYIDRDRFVSFLLENNLLFKPSADEANPDFYDFSADELKSEFVNYTKEEIKKEKEYIESLKLKASPIMDNQSKGSVSIRIYNELNHDVNSDDFNEYAEYAIRMNALNKYVKKGELDKPYKHSSISSKNSFASLAPVVDDIFMERDIAEFIAVDTNDDEVRTDEATLEKVNIYDEMGREGFYSEFSNFINELKEIDGVRLTNSSEFNAFMDSAYELGKMMADYDYSDLDLKEKVYEFSKKAKDYTDKIIKGRNVVDNKYEFSTEKGKKRFELATKMSAFANNLINNNLSMKTKETNRNVFAEIYKVKKLNVDNLDDPAKNRTFATLTELLLNPKELGIGETENSAVVKEKIIDYMTNPKNMEQKKAFLMEKGFMLKYYKPEYVNEFVNTQRALFPSNTFVASDMTKEINEIKNIYMASFELGTNDISKPFFNRVYNADICQNKFGVDLRSIISEAEKNAKDNVGEKDYFEDYTKKTLYRLKNQNGSVSANIFEHDETEPDEYENLKPDEIIRKAEKDLNNLKDDFKKDKVNFRIANAKKTPLKFEDSKDFEDKITKKLIDIRYDELGFDALEDFMIYADNKESFDMTGYYKKILEGHKPSAEEVERVGRKFKSTMLKIALNDKDVSARWDKYLTGAVELEPEMMERVEFINSFIKKHKSVFDGSFMKEHSADFRQLYSMKQLEARMEVAKSKLSSQYSEEKIENFVSAKALKNTLIEIFGNERDALKPESNLLFDIQDAYKNSRIYNDEKVFDAYKDYGYEIDYRKDLFDKTFDGAKDAESVKLKEAFENISDMFENNKHGAPVKKIETNSEMLYKAATAYLEKNDDNQNTPKYKTAKILSDLAITGKDLSYAMDAIEKAKLKTNAKKLEIEEKVENKGEVEKETEKRREKKSQEMRNSVRSNDDESEIDTSEKSRRGSIKGMSERSIWIK